MNSEHSDCSSQDVGWLLVLWRPACPWGPTNEYCRSSSIRVRQISSVGLALAAHRVRQDARSYREAAFARHAPEVRLSSWLSFNGLVQHEFRPIAKTANKLFG
jgi:hypothetical protein